MSDPTESAPLDYAAGVLFEDWQADENAPETQLCHDCECMFLRSDVSECPMCFDSLCGLCAERHKLEHSDL